MSDTTDWRIAFLADPEDDVDDGKPLTGCAIVTAVLDMALTMPSEATIDSLCDQLKSCTIFAGMDRRTVDTFDLPVLLAHTVRRSRLWGRLQRWYPVEREGVRKLADAIALSRNELAEIGALAGWEASELDRLAAALDAYRKEWRTNLEEDDHSADDKTSVTH
jgi:hypothetical protein